MIMSTSEGPRIVYLSRNYVRGAYAMKFIPIADTSYLLISPALPHFPNNAVRLADCLIRHPCDENKGYGFGRFTNEAVKILYDNWIRHNFTELNAYVVLLGEEHQFDGLLIFPITHRQATTVEEFLVLLNVPNSWRQVITVL